MYGVDAFAGRTHDEVLAQVAALGGGWHLAGIAEVSPIFALLDEASYVGSARFLLGASTSTPDGVERYLTGGRVADEPGLATFGWLWGFGTAVQTIPPSGPPTFGWSSFGIGSDNKTERIPEMGAWVVRSTATPVPEPATVWLVGAGLVGTLLVGVRRRAAVRARR